jgi:hypothetical protein
VLCDSVVDFAVAHQLDRSHALVGGPLDGVRRLLVEGDEKSGRQVWAVERHGSWNWSGGEIRGSEAAAVLAMRERFRLRKRDYDDDRQGFEELNQLMDQSIEALGVDRTADVFFEAERHYWQGRNTAGQFQKMRQDRLGLGWANHDHHTYRSSRTCFRDLIRTLEKLGMQPRERFYAGREAGWGAQVLEQTNARIVVFADVDLAPEEIVQDFAHQPLEETQSLGTVGLWCALHGEAILQAGLHHLECQFRFEEARQQLENLGLASMRPFTDLPHLRQSFTVGETWAVRESRLTRALSKGWITREQADRFQRSGALGSHLEILQRNDGYKGFNPKGISDIILETDPRHAR